MDSSEKERKLYELAQVYFKEGDHNKALEIIQDSISSPEVRNPQGTLCLLQGTILFELASRTENCDISIAYLLGCIECFALDCGVHVFTAIALNNLGAQLGSKMYYKKALKDAKESLSLLVSIGSAEKDMISILETIIRVSESMLLVPLSPQISLPKEVRDTVKRDSGTRLRSYWNCMNVESKRKFVKVSIAQLESYVERVYGREGQDALEQVLDCARTNRKWKFWLCRICKQKFFYTKKFKNHLEQEHAAKFKPSTTNLMAERVDEKWAGMISAADWEPVDIEAAAEMIKTRLEFVKGFVYENGWSKDWPLVVDEERSKLLKEIQLLLVSFREHNILSRCIRDWMMFFLTELLSLFEVTEYTVTTECRLTETPQSICFLECYELNAILDHLKLIECERNDGTDLVCRAVDSSWGLCRVKEKIGFDHQFSSMLLDRRLLRGEIASFDDEGAIDVVDENVYYAKTHPQGDDIITWLLDYPSRDDSLEFPRSLRAHNLDTWVAVMRSVQYTCRIMGIKYAKKLNIVCYGSYLIDSINLCSSEDEKRKTPEYQWKKYASLLIDKCEERLAEDRGESIGTKQFLCAVRDVLEGALQPTFDFPDLEDCLTKIHSHENISDAIVLGSIDSLKTAIEKKIPLVDSKILLVENSRIRLLDNLIRLSVFDFRSYILPLLKRFLREELEGKVDVDAKAKVAAAEADLLSKTKQDIQKKSAPKKKNKKHSSIKRTPATVSSLLDQNCKDESSFKVPPGVASPSVQAAEEYSIEPQDTLSTKSDQVEISFSTKNQEKAAKDMREEDSLLGHVKSPLRCNSALEMTLKAICNIKALKEYLMHNRHQFPENLEEEVSAALQNFITAFVSKEIKEKGVYSYLLDNLLASLEQVHCMSSDAVQLLVSIFEFWPCWRSPQIESVVARLFTVEEYERMSCRRCKKKPNYPEQSSYGIVMDADSIRVLKSAFGNIKFGGILKLIRMEEKMLCDISMGGCGAANFVNHVISTCPPIFTIVLEWEKDETERQITETTKSLDWEIDISKLYRGVEPNTNYRLVSMVCCGEEYIGLCYKKNRWFSFTHDVLVKEAVGNWNNVVRFCGERKARPEILFYEAVRSMD
ncbi:unnamed protein product [Cochlearia groenlandica]